MNKNVFSRTLIIVLLSILFSCSEDFDSQKDSMIEGKLSNSNREMIYLYELNIKSLDIIDSVRLDEQGRFKLVFTNKHKAGFYTLSVAKSPAVLLQLNAGDKIQIEGNAQNLANVYSLKNAPSSELLKQLQQKINISLDKADSIYEAYRDADTTLIKHSNLRVITDSLLRQNQLDHYNMIRKFASDNKNSLVAIYALYSSYGQKSVLDLELDFDLFKDVADALSRNYTNNIHVEDLQKRVNELSVSKKSEIDFENSLNAGNVFPDLILLDPNNQQLKLSDLKGKNTLVYLWNAKDKACWDTNQRLMTLYKKYAQKKNFEIFAVSFDTDIMLWTSAINVDKLNWKNVIMDAKTLENFRIKNLPRMFLLDMDGKILQKDISLNQISDFLSKQ